MQDEQNVQVINMFANICENNGFPLDIYNYEGVLLDKKKQIKIILCIANSFREIGLKAF